MKELWREKEVFLNHCLKSSLRADMSRRNQRRTDSTKEGVISSRAIDSFIGIIFESFGTVVYVIVNEKGGGKTIQNFF